MSFNATKCYILSVKKSTTYFDRLNNTILKEVENNPYLGLSISNDLKWTNHINNICKKASSTVGFIRRNLKHSPAKCRRTAYISLVRSTLEYGAIIWRSIDLPKNTQNIFERNLIENYLKNNQ